MQRRKDSFWYSLLKYCCTHKYSKIWDNEHKRSIKHTDGKQLWGCGRRRWPPMSTGVCVLSKLHSTLRLCSLYWSRLFVGQFRVSKAPHSPNICLFILLKQQTGDPPRCHIAAGLQIFVGSSRDTFDLQSVAQAVIGQRNCVQWSDRAWLDCWLNSFGHFINFCHSSWMNCA